ncbi:MAG: LysE family transporter, partial [Bacteroidetes bacterium]|nr:LysE family transporter [Bacteroidota bacterium]
LSNTLTVFVSALTEHSTVIAYCGSAFLIALGVYFVFFKKVSLARDQEGNETRFRKRDMARVFASGFLINTLNPSVMLFWLGNATFLAADHTLQERIVIFSICLLINMAADVLKVMMAGRLRNKLNLHTLSVINRISGSILIAFGIALIFFHKQVVH